MAMSYPPRHVKYYVILNSLLNYQISNKEATSNLYVLLICTVKFKGIRGNKILQMVPKFKIIHTSGRLLPLPSLTLEPMPETLLAFKLRLHWSLQLVNSEPWKPRSSKRGHSERNAHNFRHGMYYAPGIVYSPRRNENIFLASQHGDVCYC